MFNVILELTYVGSAVWVYLFAVLVANAIIKVANKLCSFVRKVASVPCYRTVQEFTCVLVSVVKVDQAFAVDHSFLKLALVNPALVMQRAIPVKKPVSELTSVFKFFVVPKIRSLSVE